MFAEEVREADAVTEKVKGAENVRESEGGS